MVFLSYLDIMPFLHKGNSCVYDAYENLVLLDILCAICLLQSVLKYDKL